MSFDDGCREGTRWQVRCDRGRRAARPGPQGLAHAVLNAYRTGRGSCRAPRAGALPVTKDLAVDKKSLRRACRLNRPSSRRP
ncbi:hypothetical protein QJS66_16870 [Kocuria rhizophila]|nr:hypothetical protein QJS66_16870 [Kocuria rhizophila]